MDLRSILTEAYAAVAAPSVGVMGLLVWVLPLLTAVIIDSAAAEVQFININTIQSVTDELVSKYGEDHRDRIAKGVDQVARFWRKDDGDADEFSRFCREYYMADSTVRQQTADRYEAMLAGIGKYLTEMNRDLNWHLDVVTGPLLPIDYLSAGFSPWAHLSDDMFATKIAFVALLNFPLFTLKEKLDYGSTWSRPQWAQVKLAAWFSSRVPADVSQNVHDATLASDAYISQYNIHMHHLLTPDGSRPFPKGKRLITHWNLRDELKALYSDPEGMDRQKMIFDVMIHIIRQDIPAAVIDNPAVDWTLSTNAVTVSPVVDGDVPSWWQTDKKPGEKVDNSPEPNARYKHWLAMFHAFRLEDPYYPHLPTMIQRRFEEDREMPEAEVERLLTSIAQSETVAKIGKLIEKRLGRPLLPFDIWYDGFKSRSTYAEDDLDRRLREKYPTVEAFQADMPRILRELGFDAETAAFLCSTIQVDPSRGVGHASSPGGIGDKAHLRTRVGPTGMDYKGYSIAIHELGHNVEQVFSLYKVDHILLSGVPNTGITEAFAFVFQDQDMDLMGLTSNDPQKKYLMVLDNIWGTFEIGCVSLVDMRVWRWLYDHPEATAEDLREAVITIAKNVWNEYCARIFGVRDVEILAIYSHLVDGALYLPDYPLGSIMQFQIERYLKQSDRPGKEIERMCSIGSVTPDLWMRTAVGAPISTEPLIRAAEEALQAIGKK